MNQLAFLLLAAVSFILFMFWKELSFVIAAVLVQYFSGRISSALGFSRLPLLAFDTEITNIIFAMTGMLFGLKYLAIMVALSFAVHFLHKEIISYTALVDLAFRGFFIGIGSAIFAQATPLAAVPYVIVASKAVSYAYQTLLFRFPPISIGLLYELSASAMYLIAAGFFQQ